MEEELKEEQEILIDSNSNIAYNDPTGRWSQRADLSATAFLKKEN